MIEIMIDSYENNIVKFHISRQDAEDYERLKGKLFGDEFYLISAYTPFCTDTILGVRGSCKQYDNKVLSVQMSIFLKFYQQIKRFNKQI